MPPGLITDVIMIRKEDDDNDYMQQIVDGRKSFEFRKSRLLPEVERIWFLQIPRNVLQYVCKVAPAKTRREGDQPLPEGQGMLGNREYNTHHPDWEGYNYAYEILAVYELRQPFSLADLKEHHKLQMPIKRCVATPKSLLDVVDLSAQIKIR